MAKDTKGSKINLVPRGDRVLVRREETPDHKSPAGIIIPDTAKKDKSKIGVVLSIGAGRVNDDGKLVPMDIKIGAKVIFNAGWDNEVELADKDNEYFLVRESDILAVIK